MVLSQVHLCNDCSNRSLQPYQVSHLVLPPPPFSLFIFRIFRNNGHKDAKPWYTASKEPNPDAG